MLQCKANQRNESHENIDIERPGAIQHGVVSVG
jgi:hypothetical protein